MNQKLFCILNSKLIDEKLANIPINDRGFLYGDGVFETCHIKNFQILHFELHLKRLQLGLNFLKINCDTQNLKLYSQKLIKKNNIQNGILRIYVSRGRNKIGFLPDFKAKPTVLIQTKRIKKPNKIIKIGICEEVYISSSNQFNNFKTANSLCYIMAKIAAHQQKFHDNIILNEKKEICETSSANIFWLKNNIIYTPKVECGLLNGTKRQKLIEICQKNNIKLIEGKFKINDLQNCHEIFLTNSSFLILTIDELYINHHSLKINSNRETRNLINKLKDELQKN